MLRVKSLFSGIGGFELGLSRAGGFKPVSFCEMKPHAQAVLAKNFPGIPCHDDVTTCEHKEGEADVITAGFPCQDISYAGLGAGLSGARSGLYREVIRAVRVVRPLYALLENVAALLSRGLDTVLGDLAAIGYDAEWHCIPASAVGAPHRRDRIWIIAHARGEQHEGGRPPLSGALSEELSKAYLANAGSGRYGFDHEPGEDPGEAGEDQGEGYQWEWLRPESRGSGEALAYTAGERRAEARELRCDQPEEWIASSGESVGYADCAGFSITGNAGGAGEASGGIEAGRAADGTGWWAVEPDVGRVAHGVPNRVDRLAELGNAVVPQIPEIIGRAILSLTSIHTSRTPRHYANAPDLFLFQHGSDL